MKEPAVFTSPIGPLITRYLAMKRALGRSAVTMAYTLRYIDGFLTSHHATDLTAETFTAWNESMTSLQSNTRLARLHTVYHLCLFRQREHPHSFVPDPTQFPTRDPRPLPYIFSEAEIVRLLTTAEALTPHKGSPLHREVARVGIIILYTTDLIHGGSSSRGTGAPHPQRLRTGRTSLSRAPLEIRQVTSRAAVG